MSIARTNGSEQTRQQILAAALRLFATHGYAGTSTQAIIAASRVSKPVLYYHFGSKAGLFSAIVGEAEDQVLKVISKAKARARGFRGQLVEICAALFQFARDNREAICLFLELASTSCQCPTRKQCLRKKRQLHAVIERIMEQGLSESLLQKQFSNEELVIGFRGLIRSHILQFLSDPRWPLSRKRAEAVVSLFLNGTASKLQNLSHNTTT
jgi:AcrR family transcriptional regulator